MAIKEMQLSDVGKSLYLFNKLILDQELLYKSLTKDEFILKFINSNEDFQIKSFVDLENDIIKGFIGGVIIQDKQKAYLSNIVVDSSFRRKKIATHLLKAFEDYVKNNYPLVETIDIIFFNPVQFEWIIPNTNWHDHPNAPGLDLQSNGYLFFKSMGYKEFAKQNSYYKNIENYSYNEDIQLALSHLNQNNITITFYDKNIHYGFDDLFVSLNNPYWKNEINKAINNNSPILIAEKKGLIIGFTGPLRVQKSLRGYFAGIGVHSDYRGLGIGKVLFSSLCLELKNLGAHYMTLFTGENNSARRIYEKEGFEIVRSWSNMRKEF